MRRLMLLFSLLVLISFTSTIAQTLDDYVLEVRGDTLVVKDEIDYGAPDALNQLILADTLDVPAGRVYLLHNWGYYSVISAPRSSATLKTIVMGENQQSLKTSEVVDAPPIICGAVYEGGSSTGGMNTGHDLLLKNVNINTGNSAGGEGWAFFGSTANKRIVVQNCILEHTLWTYINPGSNSKIYFLDNYFVNLSGHECRRNGGVIDFFSDQDSIIVENNTHVMAQGSLYKFRSNYKVNRALFNHNTFINCAGYSLMNMGDVANLSITNNLWVNCNVQGYCSAFQSADAGEVDPRDEPMGFVNVYDGANSDGGALAAAGATVYVDKNLIYWDPIFDDYISTLNSTAVNGVTNWSDQKITMNAPSQAMFDDDVTYPHLTEGTWIEGVKPNFADPQDLFTDQLDILYAYALVCVDTNSTSVMADWRLVNDPSEYYTYSDWPVQVDLSYDNAELLTAGLGGFPIGDLNWFPTQNAAWLAQHDAELDAIHETLYGTVDVEEVGGIPTQFKLSQNYPNPFNPTTVINFSISEAANVQLKVYNALGQEVATLVDEFKAVSDYKVNFDASNLTSGVYFYTLKVNDFTATKKMLLVK